MKPTHPVCSYYSHFGADVRRNLSIMAIVALMIFGSAIWATPAFSQAVYSSIFETITDSTGAVSPTQRLRSRTSAKMFL